VEKRHRKPGRGREREMGDGDRDVLGIEKGTLGCKDDK
jgi:hypothetical protein